MSSLQWRRRKRRRLGVFRKQQGLHTTRGTRPTDHIPLCGSCCFTQMLCCTPSAGTSAIHLMFLRDCKLRTRSCFFASFSIQTSMSYLNVHDRHLTSISQHCSVTHTHRGRLRRWRVNPRDGAQQGHSDSAEHAVNNRGRAELLIKTTQQNEIASLNCGLCKAIREEGVMGKTDNWTEWQARNGHTILVGGWMSYNYCCNVIFLIIFLIANNSVERFSHCWHVLWKHILIYVC